ncbi:hypothetical protein Q0812_01470 [Brevundimonas sp. 2R-24]|uniref:Uncharacterized protein n=1 Tax=Peiella sedimenti TaxID=3061083 RepID=A0ABT8SLF7_9CAUL|nr:hypothetical protein [Caulobacteraceae bacterium XZ-24]
MRRATAILIGLAALAGASQALAQAAPQAVARPSERMGLRYLTWPGKPATPARAAAPATAAPTPSAPARRPNRPIGAPLQAAPVQPLQAAPAPVMAAPPPVVQPAAAPAPQRPQPVPAADPMAPRRDAPIFRLTGAQGPAAAPAQPQQPAARPDGVRFYSTHREQGRQPDPIAMPASIDLNDPPSELVSVTTETQDLAAPPEAPAVVRNGRMVAAVESDLP